MDSNEFWDYFWNTSTWLQKSTLFVGEIGAAVGVILLAGPFILVLELAYGLLRGILFIRDEVRRVTS